MTASSENKLLSMMETLMSRMEKLKRGQPNKDRQSTGSGDTLWSRDGGSRSVPFRETCWKYGTHGSVLPQEPISARKLATLNEKSQPSEGKNVKAHNLSISTNCCTSSYRVSGSISGVQTSFLVDTGAAVTLVREDVWVRCKPPWSLTPWTKQRLVGVGGSRLAIRGCAQAKYICTYKWSSLITGSWHPDD